MPTKKITIAENSVSENKNQAFSSRFIFGAVIAILVLFAGNVLYETATDVHQKFAVTEA